MLLVVIATCQPQPFILNWEEKHIGGESSCENSIFFFPGKSDPDKADGSAESTKSCQSSRWLTANYTDTQSQYGNANALYDIKGPCAFYCVDTVHEYCMYVYMGDGGHWWCAHPQAWVITSRARRTGRAESAEDSLWCDGSDKEDQKSEREQNRQKKANRKIPLSLVQNVPDFKCFHLRHRRAGERVNICAEVQRFPSVLPSLCKMRCHPICCTCSPTGSPSQSSGLDWTHAQSITSRSSYTLCLCVNTWAGRNVWNYVCTVHSHTGAPFTSEGMIHDVGLNLNETVLK